MCNHPRPLRCPPWEECPCRSFPPEECHAVDHHSPHRHHRPNNSTCSMVIKRRQTRATAANPHRNSNRHRSAVGQRSKFRPIPWPPCDPFRNRNQRTISGWRNTARNGPRVRWSRRRAATQVRLPPRPRLTNRHPRPLLRRLCHLSPPPFSSSRMCNVQW